MGALTEAGLDALIAGGCPACGGRKLMFGSYLDGRLPLVGGEPVGTITWVYDGEKFVDGVFEVTCAGCKHVLFADDRCPRCHAAGALAGVLRATNRWEVPASCAGCGGEEVGYVVMVPARVVHDGGRAEKARTSSELLDPGLHGYRVDCLDCGTVAELQDRCPLCAAPAPLRPRP
jgi:hypothetical protein